MTSSSIYDHLRPTDSDYADEIYRVVGTSGETVTLLRVGDGDGRRVNTGDLERVSEAELEGFEPAANPDGNRPFGAAVASRLEMGYWSLRAFGQQLVARPVPAAVAGLLVVVGVVGEQIGPLPEILLSVMIFAGALGLAVIGSGRFR
ncbi:hypothetical protein [Natrinema versiforme]|uniref:Uncharacterized protein n=1 Tax=Natrinema versiforme JCM 10478 TaxID=1227496 RepID=L9YA83_9EURY|nr:hypothetical protein [Natrinema versiforme]ELY70627.1 hypothetical protein C489_02197 [Natrinema versiforme JCM 10478]